MTLCLPLWESYCECEHEAGAAIPAGPSAVVATVTGQAVQTFEDEETLIDTLTERESEVLELLAQGLANKQIALELGISEHTIKFHVSSIYTKLGVTNRIEAIRLGARLGLIVL